MRYYQDLYNIIARFLTSLAYLDAAFPPKNSSILVGALLFLYNFGASTSNFVAFCFTSSQNRWQFSSVLIFLRVTTVRFAIARDSAAHRSLVYSGALRLSLNLRRRIPSLNP